MQTQAPHGLASIIVPLVVIVIVVVLRGRRMAVKRPFKLSTLWIVPAIFAGVAVMSLTEFPPHGAEWAWVIGALVLGSALGWQRGRLMKIWIEPERGDLVTQGSGWAIAFLVALIVIRTALRTGLQYEAGAGAISPALINDLFVSFALGLFATQRAEMGLRAARLKRAGSGTF